MWTPPDLTRRLKDEERLLADVDLFATLPAEMRHQIAVESPMAVFGAGETIVKQGEEGQSMFVVLSGTVKVVLEPARAEVARIEPGGYFGEMSVLTGEPRSATVLAVDDVVAVEIVADLFRRLAAAHPEAIERVGTAAMQRRTHLEHARNATAAAVTAETTTLIMRMKKFLRLA